MKETVRQPSFIPKDFKAFQKADISEALDLAYLANEAFDHRILEASKIAEIIPVGVGLSDSSYQPNKERFTQADRNFKLFREAANVLMPSRAVFDASAEKVEEDSFASEMVWNLMSQEQKTKATELRTQMA